MSLATIQTAVWDILQVDSPSSADNVTLLAALNQIRVDAERRHDWVASESVGYLRVTAVTGSPLSDTKVGYSSEAPSGASLDVKQIRWVRTRDNAQWIPGWWMNRSVYEAGLVSMDRTQSAIWDVNNVLTNWWKIRLPETRNLILQDGLTLSSLRETDVDVQIACYKWLDAYASFSAPDDFLIQRGADYMMWAAVTFMNKKKGVFLPRNEGSLGEDSPQAMRDAAWDSLLLWDTGLRNNQTFIGA